MKTGRIQTAVAVIVVILVGSGLTHFLVRKEPVPESRPLAPVVVLPEPESTIKPPGINPRIAEQATALDNDALEKAIAAAKAARKEGRLKPLASTPEEFAHVLGEWNSAIFDFVRRFPKTPEKTAPEYAAYQKELDTLTANLANLLSDEELMTRMNVETPVQRARYQANLAAGSLGLDRATAGKIEVLLARAYKEFPQSAIDDSALDKKIEAMNARIISEIEALLTPEQRARLNAMGVDRVLLGQSAGDE